MKINIIQNTKVTSHTFDLSGQCGSLHNGYRPDIDGLRCISVLSVIAYHSAPALVPNGYIGVDVFFVISGFVVTQSLATRKQYGFGKDVASFYARRAQRLLPALITCLIMTATIFAIIAPPTETTSNCFETSICSLAGVANWNLAYIGIDYFGVEAGNNPFAHTWSLGVEEQFYLLYAPILIGAMIVTTRFGMTHLSAPLSAIALTACISLVLFLSRIDSIQSYFGTTERIWELASGVGCYFLSRMRKARQFTVVSAIVLAVLLTIPWLPLSRAWSTLLAVAAAGMLIFTGITVGTSGSPAIKFLSLPIFLWVGKRSYGLYLWHWPIIVLVDLTVGINCVTAPFAVASSFVAAALSFRFIENPIRALSALGTLHAIRTLLVFVTASLLAAAIIKFDRNVLNPSVSLGLRWGHAFDRGIVSDISGPIDAPTLTVIGDSHAQMLWPMLRKAAEMQPMSIRNSTGSGFLVSENLFLEQNGLSFEDRPKLITQEIDRLIGLRLHQSIVLIACRFTSYLEAGGVTSSNHSTGWLRLGQSRLRIGSDEALVAEEKSLDYTLSRLCDASIKVILMEPVPELAQSPMVGLLVQGQGLRIATITEQEALRFRVCRMLERLSLHHPNVYLWDPAKNLGNLCGGAWFEGNLYYRDNNHLNSDGALLLLPGFLEAWIHTLKSSSNTSNHDSSASKGKTN